MRWGPAGRRLSRGTLGAYAGKRVKRTSVVLRGAAAYKHNRAGASPPGRATVCQDLSRVRGHQQGRSGLAPSRAGWLRPPPLRATASLTVRRASELINVKRRQNYILAAEVKLTHDGLTFASSAERSAGLLALGVL